MRKRLSLFALVWLISLMGAMAEDVLMPQFGSQVITVGSTPITFYDMKGAEDISSSSSNNSFATTIFKPEIAGQSIKITFTTIDVRNDGSSWPARLYVYDGVFDTESVTYPTSTSEVIASSAFPSTDKLLNSYDGTYSNIEFISGDATGALSVCYVYRYAKACSGWVATVSAVTLSPMTVQSAGANYDFVNTEVWAGKQNVGMAGLGITTEGYSSPDQLQTLTFTCNNSSVVDPTALQLYAGQAASTAGMTALAGTITESAGVYTYTLTEPYALSNGNNKFMLAGDILSSAAFNTTAQVNITGITTVGGFTSFTTATPATLTVAAMYLMAEGASYTVNGSADFYDEGGKDGKVVKGFDGKVVFTPATSGSKVKLTFNSINVFYTDYAANSTGYVDYIKVYNGNSTEEADLIWQLSQAEASSTTAIVLKSTAADGKLTITHKNNISYDSNLKDGWEATVSEFVPQAMTVSNVAVTKETGTVSAGTEGKQVACIKVVTAETEPALAVQSLTFNTNNTYAQLTKAKLYYTKANTFATTTQLGEAAITDNQITLTATNSVNFREGDNYLWLVYDIQPLAANDEKVDAIIEKLTFTNGSDYSSITNPTGHLTIENKAVQACGEQTFTVQGDWQYTHTVASEYSSKYLAEQCDQTVIFKPATAGNVIQVDYADFDVYYSTSAYYGARAKYIVYDGEGTSGAILWQLDANGKKPTQIRSTGAMTIVFNPNTTSSSYTGNGWHATVKEYTPKNMAVTDVTVEQASTRLVSLGEEKAALLNVNIQTEGTLSPLTLDAMTVSLKGTEANVSTVYLLQGSTVLAQASAAATTILTLTTPVTLNEYDNEFTLAVDIKADATVEQTVDAALLSLTINGAAQSVSAGDPEGSRIIKNILLLQAGDNGTKQIGTTSLMFYDDGGADGKYTSNFEGYVTFVPTTEGYAIELVFKDFDIAYLYSGDPFNIYYANAYDSEATPDKKYGMYSKPAENESVISRAADGSLTVYIKMPSSQMNGFEVEVREHQLTSLAIESVTVTPMAPAEATKGTGDLQLMRVAVNVKGDRTPLTITGFEQDASAQLTDRHIYATGHSSTFSTANEFTNSYVISENGVYYFWFVGSINSTAEVGDIVSLTLENVVLGEQKITPQGTASTSINVVSGAHGVYRVGSSSMADYATLTAAIQTISNIGMDGAVEIVIEPGTYTEQVTIPEINGAGAANTLTIRSLSGNYNDVTYQYNNTLTSDQGVFTINGADYVTVKDIAFTSTYTSNQSPAIVVVRNAATHVAFDGCYIYTEPKIVYSSRLDLVYVNAGENNYNNHFTLTNSVLEGGYMGLRVTGHKAAADPLQQNMLISHNTFRSQGTQMIYGDAVSNLQILNNTFRGEVKNSSAAAIDWLLVGNRATIAGNDIYLTANASDNLNYQALYFRPNSYQDKENAEIYIVNNAIYAANGSTYASYALNLNSNLPKITLEHNTIMLNAEGTAASPIYIQSAPAAGSLFVNNIIQASNKGYAIRYKNVGSIANTAFRHNILYTPEATFGMPTANVSTFADWKTAVGATDGDGNLNEAVTFGSAMSLIPREDNEGRLLTAEVLTDITTDIAGKTRAATPTIGAYEYDADFARVPEMSEGYPTATPQDVKATIVIKADNFGTAKLLVLPASATAPSLSNVAAATDEVPLTQNSEVTFTATGLTEETDYIAYVLLYSSFGDQAEAYSTIAFTTAWTLRPVQVTAIAEQTVAENANVTLTATLVNEYEQAKPYTYKWYTAYDETEIGNGATLNTTVTRTTEYICCVTDRFNQKGYVSAHVNVTKAATAATFEEYNLPAGGNKYVDDAWADGVETYLYSGTYAFANTPNKAWNAYNGYAICSDNSTEATGNFMIDQFRSATGGAYEGNNFAVAYYAAPSSSFAGYFDPIQLTCSDQPQTISGFYITNTVYTLDAILNGDYANGAFAQGDYMTVTAKGFNGGVQTGEAVFYLADYRSTNSAEHYAVDTWEWFDLTSLGAVTDLQFEVFTTKGDAYGFTTPTYFCLDNFGGEQPQEDMYIDVTEGQWGTLCLPYDLAANGHNGLEIFHSDYLNTDDNRLYLLEETGVYGKGLPMVYHALTTGRIYLNRASSAETDTNVSGEENGFHASLEGMAAGTLTGKYVINPADYLVYECSATAWLRPNRCYWDDIMSPSFPHQTAYPTAAPQRRRAIGANRPNTPTGVEQPSDTTAPRKIILDGQMYIEREGHLYNAAGQYIR